MKQQPQFLTGMTVFIAGVGLLGTSKKITLPKVEQMRETITAGGFERSVATGIFKAMEAEIDLSEYHASVYKAASQIGTPPTFVAKGSIIQKGQTFPVIATFKGGFDIDDGGWETGKEAERKLKLYCDYYALEINGKEQCLFDVDNIIARLYGVDMLEKLRSHIL